MSLLVVTAGGALLGIPGAFLVVPVTAVAVNVTVEAETSWTGLGGEGPGRP